MGKNKEQTVAAYLKFTEAMLNISNVEKNVYNIEIEKNIKIKDILLKLAEGKYVLTSEYNNIPGCPTKTIFESINIDIDVSRYDDCSNYECAECWKSFIDAANKAFNKLEPVV